MTLQCYADMKHFVGRKASLTMLAGTTTAKVVQIGSSNSQSEWWNLQHGQKGSLWYSSPKCNCLSNTDVVTMLRGKGTRGSRLQMGNICTWCYKLYWEQTKKGNFYFHQTAALLTKLFLCKLCWKFQRKHWIGTKKICSSTQRKLDEGLE